MSRATRPKAWLLSRDFDRYVFLYIVKTVVCAPVFTKTVLLRRKITRFFEEPSQARINNFFKYFARCIKEGYWSIFLCSKFVLSWFWDRDDKGVFPRAWDLSSVPYFVVKVEDEVSC